MATGRQVSRAECLGRLSVMVRRSRLFHGSSTAAALPHMYAVYQSGCPYMGFAFSNEVRVLYHHEDMSHQQDCSDAFGCSSATKAPLDATLYAEYSMAHLVLLLCEQSRKRILQ